MIETNQDGSWNTGMREALIIKMDKGFNVFVGSLVMGNDNKPYEVIKDLGNFQFEIAALKERNHYETLSALCPVMEGKK